jgi:hypothetical protein
MGEEKNLVKGINTISWVGGKLLWYKDVSGSKQYSLTLSMQGYFITGFAECQTKKRERCRKIWRLENCLRRIGTESTKVPFWGMAGGGQN